MKTICDAQSRAAALLGTEDLRLWEQSVNHLEGGAVFMADAGDRDVLCAEGASFGFSGRSDGAVTVCELTHENALVLRSLFPFTAPVPVLKSPRSAGTGDRLGIATPGHIRAFRRYDAMPVLAQQSIRELKLTGRTFADVIDCASWAVFREGFRRGFGADGDHLKTPEEIAYALESGCSIITLDCSEHICAAAASMSAEELRAAYVPDRDAEARYLGRTFDLEGHRITFTETEFMRACVLYGQAVRFAAQMWDTYIKPRNGRVDFEISIDETLTPTTPLQHYFVAAELAARGVEPATMAPRFCGEFQKGVDYIGDLDQFGREAAVHAAIARRFGYKLSIHSGSDKFSAFPALGRETRGRFHLKTAGTSWLEAMKLVSMRDPALYREAHACALESFAEASKYYHITTTPATIPPLDTLPDSALPSLFERNDARQLIHITYGLLLTKKNPDGSWLLRDRLYKLWRQDAEEYAQMLDAHIGKHLELLYTNISDKE